MTDTSKIERTVFIISDGTGITAETFSHSVLSQFESVKFNQVRIPFVDSMEKADAVIERINHVAAQGTQPIAFTTLVNTEVSTRIKNANALFLDLFAGFVEPLEQNLGVRSSHSIGKSHKVANSAQYRNRMTRLITASLTMTGSLLRGSRRPMSSLSVCLAAEKRPPAFIWRCNTALKQRTFRSFPRISRGAPCLPPYIRTAASFLD